VIFVTVGSTETPFARLIEALAALPADELSVQHGGARPPAQAAEAVAFMSFVQIMEHMEGADAVVCHAGVGSILCALRAGHTPVVVPRLKRFSEAVDDHQLELTRALAHEGKVVAVYDESKLAQVLAGVPPRHPPLAGGDGPLHAAVRAAVHGTCAP
jgi:UDP-N-acetylglucosamine--N-acetylmuramyl-(pentapeptide) pyrophosphoryl-undecaprenol N-acetylglucosamine transferase